MTTQINSLSQATLTPSGRDRAGPRVPPAPVMTEPKVQVREVASKSFAKKAEVGNDMQQLAQSIEEAVQSLNEMMRDSGRHLHIGLDRVMGGPIVTVRNAESGEVVRQIPNEVVVKMAHSIEAFKGWLHDGKA